jgi:hypothetical protein
MLIAIRNTPLFAGLCFVLLLGGCSNSDRATVSGRVKLADGTPPVGSRVVAQPTSGGKAVYGTTDEQGAFTLTSGGDEGSILPGEYQVAVMENLGRGDMDQRRERKISNKYSEPGTSGLTFKVEAGEDKEVEFAVEAP